MPPPLSPDAARVYQALALSWEFWYHEAYAPEF